MRMASNVIGFTVRRNPFIRLQQIRLPSEFVNK